MSALEASSHPLFVDLDGTLIKSDLLVESVFLLLRRSPWLVLLFPLWLMKGKAAFKRRVAARVSLDASMLPYHARFIDSLRARREAGQKLYLASASDRALADRVAAHLGLFDGVLASDGAVNLSGSRKLRAIREFTGGGAFLYAGNSRTDLEVWREAAGAVVVNPEPGVLGAARRLTEVVETIDDRRRSALRAGYKMLRPHQWTKNLLLFLPLLLAHRVGEPGLVVDALLGMLAFSLVASSVYIVNDLFDLADDRVHPQKRLRPIPAGEVSLVHAAAVAAVLLLAGILLAAWMGDDGSFLAVIIGYFAATAAYSLLLKRVAVVDVLLLAGLYTVRVFAGGAATGIPISFWLLAFSMFVFLSFAVVKRYAEFNGRAPGSGTLPGRGYVAGDMELLSQFGTASGFMAVLVLALYLNGDMIQTIYQRPEWIWLMCPLVLFLIMRVWLYARRGRMNEDPVVFFLRDRPSQLAGLLCLASLWLAT